MATLTPSNRPDMETAFALLTAWRLQAPCSDPSGYPDADALHDLLNRIVAGRSLWNAVLGLLALSNELLTYLAEQAGDDPDGILAAIAQVDAEERAEGR